MEKNNKPLSSLSREEIEHLAAYREGVIDALSAVLKWKEHEIQRIQQILNLDRSHEEKQPSQVAPVVQAPAAPATTSAPQRKPRAQSAKPKKAAVAKEVIPEQYEPNWTWGQKITFLLSKEDQPLLSKEVIERLEHYEPGLFENRNPVSVVSANLSILGKTGRLVKYKVPGHRAAWFCLPSWMGDDGNMKTEYLDKIRPQLENNDG